MDMAVSARKGNLPFSQTRQNQGVFVGRIRDSHHPHHGPQPRRGVLGLKWKRPVREQEPHGRMIVEKIVSRLEYNKFLSYSLYYASKIYSLRAYTITRGDYGQTCVGR